MKHIGFLFILALGMISCSQEMNHNDGGDIDYLSFVVEPLVDKGEIDTKLYTESMEFVWEATDVLGVYPDEGGQVYFKPDKGVGTSTVTFDGGGWGFRSDSRYLSYFPFRPEVFLDRNNVPVTYVGQHQDGKFMSTTQTPSSLSEFDFSCTNYVSAENNHLSFIYRRVGSFLKLGLNNVPAGSYKKLSISSDNECFVLDGHVDLEAEDFIVIPERTSNSLSISLENITVESGDPAFKVILMFVPMNFTGNLYVSLYSEDGKKYVFQRSLTKAFERNAAYNLTCGTWTEVEYNEGEGGSAEGFPWVE